MLTLSTLILLKAAWRTLKLCINSCSSLAWNLTFFRRIQPGNNMSMNWQYAAPGRHKAAAVSWTSSGCVWFAEPDVWPHLNRAVRSSCRWDARNRWPTPACHVGWGCQWTQMWRTHSLPSPTWRERERFSVSLKHCGHGPKSNTPPPITTQQSNSFLCLWVATAGIQIKTDCSYHTTHFLYISRYPNLYQTAWTYKKKNIL